MMEKFRNSITSLKKDITMQYNTQELTEICLKTSPAMRNILKAKFKRVSWDIIEDAIQEGTLKTIQRTDLTNPEGFFAVACKSYVKDVLKRHSNKDVAFVNIFQKKKSDLDYSEDSLLKTVIDVITKLPKRDYEILKQRYFQGKTYEEMSKNIGVRKESISMFISKACKKVRQKLGEDCLI